MKKKGRPQPRELVVCKITSINPNSAFAKLVEYENLSGMIHVSEVANRWVRNIREFLKENQYVVCSVMRIEDNYISLTVKRVSKEQSSRKMKEFKRELKASKMLEFIAKKGNISSETMETQVGYPLQEAFGSLSKALDVAIKNEELFRKRSDISKKWADLVVDFAKKSYSEKVYRIKSELSLSTYNPEGVTIIKNALLNAQKAGFDVKYISAPKYTLSKSGKNIKNLQSEIEDESKRIVKEIEKAGGEGTFEIDSRAKK